MLTSQLLDKQFLISQEKKVVILARLLRHQEFVMFNQQTKNDDDDGRFDGIIFTRYQQIVMLNAHERQREREKNLFHWFEDDDDW